MQSSLATLPEEERPTAARETFHELVARLSRLSVTKHYDAYADVPWDDPAYRIEPDDTVWQLGHDDPLGATAWYQEQPGEIRSRIGLHLIVGAMQTGVHFENVLTRGLLDFAMELPAAAPEFRYAYHEAIEESHHSLMFREFVNRSGLEPGEGLPLRDRIGARRVVRMARGFSELFFLFVLGGEDPIDYVQRGLLASGRPVHPLLRRIMQIHVTEEARHLCFARAYLRARVPKLGAFRRQRLAITAPLVLGSMAGRMLEPPSVVMRTYRIPRPVLREAYSTSQIHRANVRASLEKVRSLCQELELVTPVSRLIWRVMGIA
jgi:P-aminobenzoate N-oxygenase AurF